MREISLLIKPASSLCNLNCKYCFYCDVSHNRKEASMGKMEESTMEALIQKVTQETVERIRFCFQGGEPSIIGVDWFKKFIALVNKNKGEKKVSYAIQTNGTLLDDAFLDLLKENDFLVGISLDGYRKNHNFFRKDKEGNGTFKQVQFQIRKLKNKGIPYNILTVLTHELSLKPEELFDFYVKNAFDYIQLIPCLPSLSGTEKTDIYALRPKDFSNFYKKFFDLWFEEYRRGHYISVTLFDNLIPMYIGVYPEQCGMLGTCSRQLVVEGNGNVYPCDFYVLDTYYCGNIKTEDLKTILHNASFDRFLQEKRRTCLRCSSCKYIGMCHQNCKRLNVAYFDDTYCGYEDFLSYTQKRMESIAKTL